MLDSTHAAERSTPERFCRSVPARLSRCEHWFVSTAPERGVHSGTARPPPLAVRGGMMRLKQIKRVFASVWVLLAVVVGVAAGVRSTGGLVALAAPRPAAPLARMLLWNDPPETMSESIRGGRR